MPRRKKRNANLCVKRKGYWKVWKKQKTEEKDNEKVVGFKDNVVEFETCIETNIEEKNSSNVNTSGDNMSASAAFDDANIVPSDEKKQKKLHQAQDVRKKMDCVRSLRS